MGLAVRSRFARGTRLGNVKNEIAGNYHGVSRRWLQGYLNEYVWRLNHRHDPSADFETLLSRAADS